LPKNFTIKAGKTALAHIKKRGLSPDDISVIPAAAGGPKWIALHAFDKYLMTEWFHDRKTPLHLVGASAGAWRMLCYCLPDPTEALDRFLQSYIEQSYKEWPTPDEVLAELESIVVHTLGDKGIEHLLEDSVKKLYVISTQTTFPEKKNSKYRYPFGKIAIKNLISRSLIKHDVNRLIFTNASSTHIIKGDGFKTVQVPFDKNNIKNALRSTGTIPMLMNPVNNISGIDGLIWDGALIDYHIGLDYNTDKLVFYPHFSGSIIEGWFDKFVKWRKFNGAVLDKMILISPTDNYINSLPNSKIPDRKDFEIHFDNEELRIKNWYEVARRGEEMVQEFDDLWRRGNLINEIISF
jgi:hypothetical protein